MAVARERREERGQSWGQSLAIKEERVIAVVLFRR
jgi:hypothetical protein